MQKGLKTLIKLHKNDIDKQVMLISNINLQLNRLNIALDHLKKQIEQELNHKAEGLADITASYIKTNLERQKLIKAEIAKIEESLAREQEILRLLFENQKKYEIIDAKQTEKKIAKAEKQEQALLDEINLYQKRNIS